MPEINLPLSADNKLFIKTLSSDGGKNIAFETFLPIDLILTYFCRFPRLVERDIPGNDATQGAPLDFTISHPLYGWFILMVAVGLGALNGYREYDKQKKSHNNTSYQFIYNKLDQQLQKVDNTAQPVIKKRAEKRLSITKLENYLQKMHQKDAGLNQKYESICIKRSINNEPQLSFKLREPAASAAAVDNKDKNKPNWFRRYVINKFISPIWEMLGISSFAYWLLWMSSGVVRGEFDVGVGGLDPAIGFGVPLAIGGAYAALKSYRWFKHHRANAKLAKDGEVDVPTPKQSAEAEEDACRLLRKAILDEQFQKVKRSLKQELGKSYRKVAKVQAGEYAESLDKRIQSLGKNAKTKAATTFISSSVSTYVGVQYGAWIVTDILTKVANVATAIPIVNTICGWAFMAGSLAYGLYNGIKTYSAVKKQKQALANRVGDAKQEAISLETVYKQKLATLSAKQNIAKSLKVNIQLPKTVNFKESQFYSDVTRQGESRWTKFKKGAVRALSFANGITTGAFIARIFCVKGTAVFLPFAAAALSNPVTIGIIACIGVAYGLFKLYEYHQARKEERAQNLLKEYGNRIDCLKQEIELADISLQVLDKRLAAGQVATNTVATAPVIQEPRVGVSKALFHSQKIKRPSSHDYSPVSTRPLLAVA